MCNLIKVNQKGDVMLEALISIVLMAVIVMGVAIMTTQAAKNLADTKTSILVVSQLKNKLASGTRGELCDPSSRLSVQMPDDSVNNILNNCSATKIELTVVATKVGAEVAHSIPSQIDAPIIFEITANELTYKVGGAIQAAPAEADADADAVDQ